jgi:DNA modification methylase
VNYLYYGDNLDVLRRYIKDESIHLVYLDPPFKSNQDYNVLFAEQDGTRSAAQIKAFEDTWQWDQGAAAAFESVVEAGGRVSQAMTAFRAFLGESDMLAYLAMMAPRLVELKRVLKQTGSIYLHCDPTASHYLKMLMDAVFDPQNLRNEIIWQRTSAHSDAKQGAQHFGRVHDVLLFYSRSETITWDLQYVSLDDEYIRVHYPHTDPETGRRYGLWDITGPGGAAKGNPYYEIFGIKKYWRYSQVKMVQKIKEGRIVQPRPGAVPREIRYLDESAGTPVGSIWSDIGPINSQAKERLGYPTQKPEALLERIIKTSSNEGDIVLDPFCGCGTAVAVSQRLLRRWVGIDITHLAITLIRHRLETAYGGKAEYKVVGEPVSLPDAVALAEQDKYQFQWWALGLVGARPTEQKKGADQGIDGRLYFHDEAQGGKTKQIILSVKGGGISVKDIRDLRGVVDREKADIGVLITLEEPTKPMRVEANSAGFYESLGWKKKYPRLQILTIAQLLEGASINRPPSNVTFKQAPKALVAEAEQLYLTSEPAPKHPTKPKAK